MGPWESESTDMCHGAIAKDGSGGRKAGGLTEPTAYQSICTILPFPASLAYLNRKQALLQFRSHTTRMQRPLCHQRDRNVEAKKREGLVATLEKPRGNA